MLQAARRGLQAHQQQQYQYAAQGRMLLAASSSPAGNASCSNLAALAHSSSLRHAPARTVSSSSSSVHTNIATTSQPLRLSPASAQHRIRSFKEQTRRSTSLLSTSVPLDLRSIPLTVLLSHRRYQSTEASSTTTTTTTATPSSGSSNPVPPLQTRSSTGRILQDAQKITDESLRTKSPASSSTTSRVPSSLSEKQAPSSLLTASTSAAASTTAPAPAASKELPSSKEKSSSSGSLAKKDKSKLPLSTRVWAKIKHEAHHYWSGTKLLGKEIKISARLQLKLLRGKSLTRREKRQLKRTTQDLLRLIPFIPFLVIPFMELLLPVALKIFPNMLPSTFEDKHAADEKKRKLLKVRLEMAKFLQETIRESGLPNKSSQEKLRDSEEFRQFFRKVRSTGENPTTQEIVNVAKLFEDDLTLDNLSRPQLVSMCRYMNINAFGTDNFLRYTIRNRLAQLGKDDRLIDAEGVDALSAAEVAHACASRGIRTTNVEPERQKAELAQWIDLHLHHGLSGVLLILSKAFSFTEKADGTTDHLTSLKDTLSSLPDSLLNETELAVSSGTEDDMEGVESIKQRLEVLEQQEELIQDEAEQEEEEREARELKKKLEAELKEKLREEKEEKERAAREQEAKEQAEQETAKFEAEKEKAQEMLPPSASPEVAASEGTPAASADGTVNPTALKMEEEFAVAENAEDSIKDVRMTTEQLSELGEALFILSAKSSVVRERQDLAKLMEDSRSTMEETAAAAAEGQESPKEERKVTALEKRIQKMITQIDEQLEAYDQEVSNKMDKFECPEGKISVKNLRTAFEQIRHRPDDDTITALIEKLDVDGDGFVPLDDVTSLAEVEGLGVVIDDAADQLIGQGQEIRSDEPALTRKDEQPSTKIKKEEKKPKREEIVE